MKNRTIKPWTLPLIGAAMALALALTLIAAALASDGSEYFIPSLRYGGVFPPSGISIFGVTMYGLMNIAGGIVSLAAMIKCRELFNMSLKNSVIIMAVFYVQSVIGAKLLFAIQTCIGNGDFLHWDFSGFSLYGAIFGMIIVAPILAAIMKLPKKDVADVFTVGGIIYLAFGRLGCFFNACCGSKLFHVGGHPLYFPVQLTEVFIDFVIAAVLLSYCHKAKNSEKRYIGAMPPGIITYGAGRFLLEFIRDSSVTCIGLTEAQIHSLIIIAVGAGMWIYAARKNRSADIPAERKPLRIKLGVWAIPATAAVAVAVFAVFLVINALSSDGSSYAFPFIVYGGAVKPMGAKVLGLALYRFIDAIGALAGVGAAVLFARRMGIKASKAFAFAVSALLVGFIGGKLLFMIENIYDIGHFRIEFDGQSLFGVLYFAVIFTPLLARVFDLKKRTAYDIAAVLWLVSLIIARVGCVFSGCCGGKTFTVGSSPVTFPAQLAEIFCNLIILACILRYTGKKRKNGEKYLGAFPIFLMSYSAARFLLEFVRTNPVTHLATTEAQKHALLAFVIGLVMALRAKPYEAPAKKEKRKK